MTESDIWYCEQHPEFLMGHDEENCGGCGILEEARIPQLLNQNRLLRQEIWELKIYYGDIIKGLLDRIQ